MANSKIKGITIEIDGSTKGLDQALQDVNKRSRDLQSELREVERALKFNPGNAELLAQKQQLLSEQVNNTTKKLEQLKSAQSQVEKQFQSGDIGADQYRAFQREIIQTESKIDKLKKELSSMDDIKATTNLKSDFQDIQKEAENAGEEVKDLGGELTNLLAGAASGKGISDVIEDALSVSSTNTKIYVSMELDEDSQEFVKKAINTVTSYGVDAEAALEGVRRQWALNKDASDETNASVVQGAATIVAAYGDVDFTELIQESNELSKTLGVSNEEVLGMTYSLLKLGFPPDQLDIITEYGSQLKTAGYNAQEIQGIMAAGVKTGSWNIDVLLDGLKEGRIRLAEFGQEVPKSLTSLISGTSISTNQLQEWGRSVAKGGEEGKKAMTDVASAIAGIEDKTKQNAIGTQVFGTLWEENGTKITDTILGMNKNIMTAEANQNNLNGAIQGLNADPAIKMQEAMGNLKLALEPILIVIADVISKIAEWMSNNPTLAATIVAIVTVIGILIGLMMGLAPIFTAITAAVGILNIAMLPLIGIIVGVIAAIAAVIAIGVLLYKNWDTIKAKAAELWSNLKTTFSNLKDGIVNKWNEVLSGIKDVWNNVVGFFKDLPGEMLGFGKNIIDGLINGITSKISEVASAIKGIADKVTGGIRTALDIHSPSRVLEKMGEYTGEGFINGINSTINGIANASKSMANAVNPQAQFSSTSSNSTYGDTIIYAKVENILDGKVIAKATTPMVISNITKGQVNKNIGLGRG